MFLAYSVEVDGFVMVEGLLAGEEVDALIAYVKENVVSTGLRGGVRNFLDLPIMRELAESEPIWRQVEAVLGAKVRVVRGDFV